MPEVVLLAVDDDPIQLELIASAATRLEYPPVEVVRAESVADARAAMEARIPDLIICDRMLPDGDGREILAEIRRKNPLVPYIAITADESVKNVVELIKEGARDYLVKPLNPHEIQQLIASNLAWREDEADYEQLAEADTTEGGIAYSVAETMKSALRLSVRAADSDASILIQGENGTGKELLARFIHCRSKRHDNPFVTVHVAALPETLVESQLFGHRKGSFTGADADRRGFFEQAATGTLFVDEIGEIPLSVQVKLLRALQFKEIQRVGDSAPRAVDVRILAATNKDLEAMVRDGTFREDLFYRINVITVQIPPLRERRADIPHLVQHMIREAARKNGRTIEGITQRALNLLVGYTFPGNVRELENIIERSVILSKRRLINEDDLPGFIVATGTAEAPSDSLDDQLQDLEKRLILEALESTEGNQSRAASLLQITERRLRSRMERLSLKNPY